MKFSEIVMSLTAEYTGNDLAGYLNTALPEIDSILTRLEDIQEVIDSENIKFSNTMASLDKRISVVQSYCKHQVTRPDDIGVRCVICDAYVPVEESA